MGGFLILRRGVKITKLAEVERANSAEHLNTANTRRTASAGFQGRWVNRWEVRWTWGGFLLKFSLFSFCVARAEPRRGTARATHAAVLFQ